MDIIINERQEQLLMNTILKEDSSVNFNLDEKRLELKDFLDKNFIRGSLPEINDEGNPDKKGIVVMLVGGKPEKPMYDYQLFNYIQAHKNFKEMLPVNEIDQFLKDSIIAWYNRKINRNGSIIA